VGRRRRSGRRRRRSGGGSPPAPATCARAAAHVGYPTGQNSSPSLQLRARVPLLPKFSHRGTRVAARACGGPTVRAWRVSLLLRLGHAAPRTRAGRFMTLGGCRGGLTATQLLREQDARSGCPAHRVAVCVVRAWGVSHSAAPTRKDTGAYRTRRRPGKGPRREPAAASMPPARPWPALWAGGTARAGIPQRTTDTRVGIPQCV
jgi:hypothetical protein